MKSVVLSFFLVFLAMVLGCAQKPRSLWPDGAVEALDRYYEQYLTGHASEARTAMTNAIALMQSVDPGAHGRAHGLWLAHARLFALEKHAGHDADALVFFDAAKDWYRAKLETSGETSQEIIRALQEFTPESCLEIVQRFDAAHTQGKGPRYRQETNVKTEAQQAGKRVETGQFLIS